MRKLIIMLIVLQSLVACNLAAGSYPYAEIFEINSDEPQLVALAQRFVKEHPDYCIPANVGLKEGRDSTITDHWYHLYFYYKSENRIVNAWIRQGEPGNSKFALYAINNGLSLGNWKLINKDFDRVDNKMEIKKFRKQILNKILAYKKGLKVDD